MKKFNSTLAVLVMTVFGAMFVSCSPDSDPGMDSRAMNTTTNNTGSQSKQISCMADISVTNDALSLFDITLTKVVDGQSTALELRNSKDITEELCYYNDQKQKVYEKFTYPGLTTGKVTFTVNSKQKASVKAEVKLKDNWKDVFAANDKLHVWATRLFGADILSNHTDKVFEIDTQNTKFDEAYMARIATSLATNHSYDFN